LSPDLWTGPFESGISRPIGDYLRGHIDSVRSIAYSPDGRHIVSGGSDQVIRIWNAKTGVGLGEPLKGHEDGVFSVTYSSDVHNIVSGSRDRTIRI
jgi:WD40 repeat protein